MVLFPVFKGEEAMKAKWFQSNKEIAALDIIQYQDTNLFYSPVGLWFHSDEVWLDICGPFPTRLEAEKALNQYSRSI